MQPLTEAGAGWSCWPGEREMLIDVLLLALSFLCNLTLDGIAYTFGVFVSPLMEHFNIQKGPVSLIGKPMLPEILGGRISHQEACWRAPSS